MKRLVVFLVVVVAGLPVGSRAVAQGKAGLYGTYSNLARSKESGDLDGYELTLVAQSGSAYAVFECSQGAPSKTVFVPVHMQGKRIGFRVEDTDNACNGEYTGVFTAGGLRLHSAVVGDTQFVPRRASFWISSMPAATQYERVTGPLFDQLAMACPGKHLEEMAPADLDFQIEAFTPLLSAARNKRFEARAKEECKDSIAGVGCGNAAFLEMAEKEGFLRRFVGALCAANVVCTEQAVCGPVKK